MPWSTQQAEGRAACPPDGPEEPRDVGMSRMRHVTAHPRRLLPLLPQRLRRLAVTTTHDGRPRLPPWKGNHLRSRSWLSRRSWARCRACKSSTVCRGDQRSSLPAATPSPSPSESERMAGSADVDEDEDGEGEETASAPGSSDSQITGRMSAASACNTKLATTGIRPVLR